MILLSASTPKITFEPTPFFFLLIAFIIFIIADRIKKTNRKKNIKKSISELKHGDKIVLTNGMFGTLVSHVEGTVDVELSSGVRARFMDWAVSEVNGEKI